MNKIVCLGFKRYSKKSFPECFMPEVSFGSILTKKSLNELDILSGSVTRSPASVLKVLC